MSIRLGVVMDPIQTINYQKDSTLAMLLAAHQRQWPITYFEPKDLYVRDGIAYGVSRPLTPHQDAQQWYTLGEPQHIALADLDVILMRKDPPFNNDYIYSTYILEKAERAGVLVVNRPQSLRDCNEKLFATDFPQCCAPVLVSQRADLIRAFADEQAQNASGDIILKPLDGMGGASIFRSHSTDPNLSVIIETLTHHQRRQVMVQRFIPEISAGDKRVLMIDGEAIPYALARIPAQGESRGNLAAGGRGEGQPLSERDRWICQQVGPTLQAKGILFAGLDIIGDYLTEINVTSPTCIRELDRAFALDISGQLLDKIAQRQTEQRTKNRL